MEQTRPPYKTLHPAIKGTATVQSNDGANFRVDLDTGVCDCSKGDPFWWNAKAGKWQPNRLCTHKLRAIASIISQSDETTADELTKIYWKQLSERYNVWEAVSAFHKELRRNDPELAAYWALVLVGHRKVTGVIRYMLNIMFEETRDIPLYRYIMMLGERGERGVSIHDMLNAVERFAVAPKKWELPHRLPIFLDEMQGYKHLALDYGYEVAKGKDIIDAKAFKLLKGVLLQGFAEADRVKVQIGLKGLFKSKSDDHDLHKRKLFNILTDVLNGEYPNTFAYNQLYAEEIQALHIRRLRSFEALGYHELNALADALTGEQSTEQSTLSPVRHRALISRPNPPMPPLGVFHNIPMYAHDNHTFSGKAKMRAYGDVELQPGADQTHMDFRMCGAYFGVAWRHLAHNQFGTIDVPFGKVKWKPTWLWKHINSMWY